MTCLKNVLVRVFFDRYETAINSLIAAGLLDWDGAVLRLTATGQDFANRVFGSVFVDAMRLKKYLKKSLKGE